jgi:DNA-binding response OmpR family regulator
MRGTILLVHGDRKSRQLIYKILRATQSEIEFADSFEEVQTHLANRPYDLAVIDYDKVEREGVDEGALARLATRHGSGPRFCVLSEQKGKDSLVRLFRSAALTNLVAKDVGILAEEMVITVEKILRRDVFGMEKYLTWGITPVDEVVSDSTKKNDHLERFEAFCTDLGLNSRLVGLAKGVADEFLMNAIYNAPVDEHGRHIYSKLPRTERVVLTGRAQALFQYACDGRYLALAVSDNFGTLTKETILRYLAKCFSRGDDQIDKKQGGAGIGFYYIVESLNSFVINIAPGERTEVLGLIDVQGSYKDFAERSKSFNIFVKEASR